MHANTTGQGIRLLLLSAALTGMACSGGTGETGDTETTDGSHLPEGAVTVDATNNDAWVYFDLEAGAEVSPATPEDSTDWDVAFRRFNVASNSGTSGTGMVGVAVLDGVTYEEVTQAPADGYDADDVTDPDSAMGTMPETMPGYAFDEWYDYDIDTHVLTPKGQIHIVRTVESNYYKFELLDYYDQAGSSGYPAFRFDPISPPPP